MASSRRRLDFLWVAIAILGLVILSPDFGDDLDGLGVLFAVVAGCGWAAFILLSKRVGQALPGGSGLAFGLAIAALFLLPLAIDEFGPIFADPALVLTVAVVAVLSTTVPFYLEFEALRLLPAYTYGILVTLEPAVATMVGVMLLDDRLDMQVVLAIGCVTAAAMGATLFRRR